MTVLTFQPAETGGWLAIAAGPRVLVVEPSAHESVPELWSSLRRDDAVAAAIGILAHNGFAATPAFALIEWDDSVLRSVVRGSVELTVFEPSGEHVQNGEGVSTWTERSFPGAHGVRLAIRGAVELSGMSTLPLVEGVAVVSGCTITLPGADARPTIESAATPLASTGVSEVTVAGVPDDTAATSGGQTQPSESGTGYDYLFGDTVFRSVSGAAVQEADAESTEADNAGASATERDGDHDGHTVLTADIAKLKAGRTPAATRQGTSEPADPRIVLALSTGSKESLDQPILVGRSPSVSKVPGAKMPRLVTVGGADQDISRNHATIALEGGTVVVTDLHSRNGTLIVLPGKDPQKLRAGEPTAVLVGTVVDLGGGITLTIGEE